MSHETSDKAALIVATALPHLEMLEEHRLQPSPTIYHVQLEVEKKALAVAPTLWENLHHRPFWSHGMSPRRQPADERATSTDVVQATVAA